LSCASAPPQFPPHRQRQEGSWSEGVRLPQRMRRPARRAKASASAACASGGGMRHGGQILDRGEGPNARAPSIASPCLTEAINLAKAEAEGSHPPSTPRHYPNRSHLRRRNLDAMFLCIAHRLRGGVKPIGCNW
jgi:hypothetical protein